MTALPIHPFPARMAPDIALAQCALLRPGAVVLDPMAGSGTVLRAAAEQGMCGVGFDTDPLAVLMTRVWTTAINPDEVRAAATEIVAAAGCIVSDEARLAWIDEDAATKDFVNYWFAPRQQADLRRLSFMLQDRQGTVEDALRIALSRIIITKDRGASLGRDVSHSRPHRSFNDNEFPVMKEFVKSAHRLARRLEAQPPPGNVQIHIGDARELVLIGPKSVDAVITSPPYLNALDYIRGHRLSLVWLGHRVGDLRMIRAANIGAERAPDSDADLSILQDTESALPNLDCFQPRIRNMIHRYLIDLTKTIQEVRRVLKIGGKATFVIGNSRLAGVFVDNAAAVMATATAAGLTLISRHERELPPSRRYLPPPAAFGDSELTKRMRTEVILDFSG